MPSVNTQQLSDAATPPFRHLDAPTQERVRDLHAPAAPPQALRRTGLRPYAFNGAAMATICGVTPALPYWYELNIHRTVLGTYVSDIRLFHKSEDHPDLFRVAEHDDLEAALRHFEAYDPSADLAPPRLLVEATASGATLALRTAQFQLQVNQITDHYRALSGALLSAVEDPD